MRDAPLEISLLPRARSEKKQKKKKKKTRRPRARRRPSFFRSLVVVAVADLMRVFFSTRLVYEFFDGFLTTFFSFFDKKRQTQRGPFGGGKEGRALFFTPFLFYKSISLLRLRPYESNNNRSLRESRIKNTQYPSSLVKRRNTIY